MITHTHHQHFLWNFIFLPEISLPKPPKISRNSSEEHWEIRFFYPSDYYIPLRGLTEHTLRIGDAKLKTHDDKYCLIPNFNANIKERKNTLWYKPTHMTESGLLSYEKKINLNEAPPNDILNTNPPVSIQILLERIQKEGIIIPIQKELLRFKPFKPLDVTLELSRITIDQHIFYSICLSSYEPSLLTYLYQNLFYDSTPSEYMLFLTEHRELLCSQK